MEKERKSIDCEHELETISLKFSLEEKGKLHAGIQTCVKEVGRVTLNDLH